MKCKYNVILLGVRATIVAVGSQYVLQTYSEPARCV